MIYAPDYYLHFRCIASACRHSCCIGWEIDIDDAARAAYAAVEGAFGARLAAAIEESGDGPHFRLDAHERCPMLRDDGLCDLILTLGEDALCQICTDHPRFRNFFVGRTEIGLGLCCEAAAALVLEQASPMRLIAIADDDGEATDEDESALLALRETLIATAGDPSLSLDARMKTIAAQVGLAPDGRSIAEWQKIYRGLTRLDSAWDAVLDLLDGAGLPQADLSGLTRAWDAPFARLLEYLLFRHLPDARDDGRMRERVAFALLGTQLVRILFACGEMTMARLCDLARMYSSEIEYDSDNVEALLDALEEKICCT